MRVRLRITLGQRTGPQYNAGEVVELPEIQAADFLARGLAERVPDEEPKTTALDDPPVDRAIKRGGTVRK